MRIFNILALGLLLVATGPQVASSEDDFTLFVKICSNSPKTIRRNCSGVTTLPVENTRIRLYAYLELTWLSPNQKERSLRPLYLRWEFNSADGKTVPLANPDNRRTYIWRPAVWNSVTFWDVNQRAYQDMPGIYRFVVYSDRGDWKNSIVEEVLVSIGSDAS